MHLFNQLHLGHLVDAFVPGNSYIHSDSDFGCYHARCQPAQQEQFGVQYLAQGHFDMQGIKKSRY